jgi:beta-lactamase class A
MRNRIARIVAVVAMTACAWGRPALADDAIDASIQAAESRLGARVGAAVLDTGSGRVWLHRADERFPMASTSKVLVCAALLKGGPALMGRQATILEGDLQSYSPVTKTLVGKQASASELCAITMRTSDNTAVNEVLEILGGPQAVTSFVRNTGDQITRLDRNEPTLNEGQPGDPRDTTTPRAMADTLRGLVLGSALDAQARDQLTDWLTSNEVGGPLLRAGIPADWGIADRTGAGGFGTRGVVAVMWPPGHAPVVAAIYVTQTEASMEERNAAISAVGKAIAKEFSAGQYR